MIERKSFSLPEEIAAKIDRYAALTGLKASTIATKALEDFMNKPDVKAIVALPSPIPPTKQN